MLQNAASDQGQHCLPLIQSSTVSDLGLHCFQRPICPNTFCYYSTLPSGALLVSRNLVKEEYLAIILGYIFFIISLYKLMLWVLIRITPLRCFIIIIIRFFINMQVQGQHQHQWAPFQVAGLLQAWQISHQISRYVYHEGR